MKTKQETGYVVQTWFGKAKVRIPRTSSCQICSHKGTCCDPFGSDFMLVEALNRPGARQGQRVVLELPPAQAAKAYVFLYLLPLAGLLIGAVFGYNIPLFGEAEASAAIFSMLFLIAAFSGIFLLNRLRWSRDAGMQMKIVSILPPPENELTNARPQNP